MVPLEYRPYKGRPDELEYRAASPEEEMLCRRTERNGRLLAPIYLGFVAVFVWMVWLYKKMNGLDIFAVAIMAFMVLGFLAMLPSVFSCFKKSISFEVADGTIVRGHSVSSDTNDYRYSSVSVWCQKEQKYLDKVRCNFDSHHVHRGDDILVVRGYRGEGKKPNCFAILKCPTDPDGLR